MDVPYIGRCQAFWAWPTGFPPLVSSLLNLLNVGGWLTSWCILLWILVLSSLAVG